MSRDSHDTFAKCPDLFIQVLLIIDSEEIFSRIGILVPK